MLLLRKRIFLDTNAMEFARIKALLAQNGIKYEVKTTMSDNVLSRQFNAVAAAHLREAYDKFSAQVYVYSIYVRPADYHKARALSYSK